MTTLAPVYRHSGGDLMHGVTRLTLAEARRLRKIYRDECAAILDSHPGDPCAYDLQVVEFCLRGMRELRVAIAACVEWRKCAGWSHDLDGPDQPFALSRANPNTGDAR